MHCHVLPCSSRNAISEIADEYIKVKITAAAVDGKANKAVVAFLSKSLKISKSGIVIAGGETSRQKRLLFKGIPAAELMEKIRGLK